MALTELPACLSAGGWPCLAGGDTGGELIEHRAGPLSFRMTLATEALLTLATEAISDLYVVLDKVIMKCDSLPVAQVSYECTYLA